MLDDVRGCHLHAGDMRRGCCPQAHPQAAVGVSQELTAQEMQVAQLVRDGLSNPEIGARLFISSHTVQYYLSKVFTKLGHLPGSARPRTARRPGR